MHGQVFAIVGNPGKLVAFQIIEGIGQRHVAVRMMMAVGFAIGGNVHDLRPVALGLKPLSSRCANRSPSVSKFSKATACEMGPS